MEETRQPVQRVKRPFWLVILLTFIGSLMVAGVIALADFYGYYFILLFPALMGVAGGIFGWVVLDERDLGKTRWATLGGALGGLFIFVAYRFISYWLIVNDEGWEITFWDYTQLLAQSGTTLSRRVGSSGIDLNTSITWALWLGEALLATVCGGFSGKRMEIPT